MTDKNKAIILAVEASGLPALLADGASMHPMSHEDTLSTLQDAGTWLGPRGRMEDDPRFRQIIPYIVLRQGDKVVTYVRGASGGEDRLHGKLSIGLGGHIDLPDIVHAGPQVNLAWTLANSADRELEEEVSIHEVCRSRVNWLGLLTDNTDDVGKVHIGVVGVIDIDQGVRIKSQEDSQEDLRLMSFDELASQSDRLEGWTRIALSSVLQPHEPV